VLCSWLPLTLDSPFHMKSVLGLYGWQGRDLNCAERLLDPDQFFRRGLGMCCVLVFFTGLLTHQQCHYGHQERLLSTTITICKFSLSFSMDDCSLIVAIFRYLSLPKPTHCQERRAMEHVRTLGLFNSTSTEGRWSTTPNEVILLGWRWKTST
jgi:hypothetical protein